MEKLHRSQLAKISLFLFLLLLIPFISASLKSSYLYFILNLLIIVLGAEAGLLPSIPKPCADEKKQFLVSVSVVESPPTNEIIPLDPPAATGNILQVRKKLFEVATEKVQKLKRCPSRPSIFFIGSCDVEEEEEEEKEEKVEVKEVVGEISKQELFLKAEMFIGNFYKQLKMQREKSWQKIHGLYDRAF